MPQIQPYTSQITAQGARADAEDFGAQTGAALMNVAGGAMDLAQAIHQQEVQADVNNIQVQMAKSRAEWTAQLRDRANQAQPGDQTFAPRLLDDLRGHFEKLAQTVKTRRGQEVFNTLAANMQADFTERSIATQARLAAEGAKNNAVQQQEALGQTVFQDPTQRAQSLQLLVDYTNSLPGVDQAWKAARVQEGKDYLNRMSVLGQIQRDPYELLARVNPKDIQGPSLPAGWTATGGTPKTVPGMTAPGNIDITTRPRVQNQDGSVSTVRSMGVNIDGKEVLIPTVVDGKVVSDEEAIAHYKQTGENLGVFSSAAASSAYAEKLHNQQAASVDVTQQRQLRTGDAAFDALPADQQFQLVKQAREYKNAYDTDNNRQRMEEERKKKEAQEGVMNSMLTRIITPSTGQPRPTAREIMSNPTLESNQKQHLVDYMYRFERERSEGVASKQHPTEVRRLLTDVYRGEDDPKKTYSMDAAMESYRQGKISTAEMQMIRREVDNLRSPDKSPFQKEVGRFRATVEKAMLSDAVVRGMSRASADIIPAALQRFNSDLDAKIEEYRQAGKNPRDLLTPGSRDYFLGGGRMQSYLDDATSTMGASAAQQRVAPAATPRMPGESPADYLKRVGK